MDWYLIIFKLMSSQTIDSSHDIAVLKVPITICLQGKQMEDESVSEKVQTSCIPLNEYFSLQGMQNIYLKAHYMQKCKKSICIVFIRIQDNNSGNNNTSTGNNKQTNENHNGISK